MSLSRLRKIIASIPKDETGVVTSVGSLVVVSCPSGSRKVSSAIPVSVGDSVLIVGGSIQSIVPNQDHLPHYYL